MIKRKSDVFNIFKKYKAYIENQSSRKIKVLRTDGGGEYTSKEFLEFCDEAGIVHEFTPPYTPQHNGAAERKNRTIMNMVRSMLKCKDLPQNLWSEAASTTVYVMNRSPSKRLNGVTPKEAWSGIKPNVKHLRIFGAICYKHIPDQLRQKLDDKGERMVFLGYHETRGYRLFDPRTKQIAISRDVEFDEFKNWRLEPESTSRNARFLI